MIALIGFMGSGKSTLARTLGKEFDLPVYEIDQMVYDLTSSPDMPTVFAKGGEEYLRASELEALEKIANSPVGIIDGGAGLVTYQPSLEKLQTLVKHIIFLDISFELSRDRVGTDPNRPLFADEEAARERYDMRIPLYNRVSTSKIIITGQPIEDLVLEVKGIIDES